MLRIKITSRPQPDDEASKQASLMMTQQKCPILSTFEARIHLSGRVDCGTEISQRHSPFIRQRATNIIFKANASAQVRLECVEDLLKFF